MLYTRPIIHRTHQRLSYIHLGVNEVTKKNMSNSQLSSDRPIVLYLAFSSGPLFLKIKVLRNQGLFQTLEKFQVLHTWIFFSVCHLDFFQVYRINLAFFHGGDLEK